MKALSASLITVLLALLPLTASPADSGKVLQNVKGSVTWGQGGPGNPGTPLKNTVAHGSTTVLTDGDSAATGANSLATITLPDSSKIIMDSNSNVQMTSFNQTDIAHAKFFVVGKMRFEVQHPNGAQADYTFSTSTGQIAVRGTTGYIFSQPGGMQVVVVQASQPVVVTIASTGQVFTLVAGQSLIVTTVAGVVTASVGTASQSMLSSFSQLSDANLNSLGVSVTSTTAGAAGAAAGAGAGAGAIAAGAAGAAAAAATALSNNNSNPSPAPSPAPTPTPTPVPTTTPSPTPQPTSTSVPITVSKQTPAPKMTLPPPPPMPAGPHFPGVRPTPGAR
jgi:hypothetical protein